MLLRFDSLAMQHRMAAIGKIIMEKGYPTIICLQATQSPPQSSKLCVLITFNASVSVRARL